MDGTSSASGTATSRPDVLIVDDESVVREGVRKILEAEGLTVAVAEDAAAALDHPGLANCRLVLCDLVLPDGSGIDLIVRLLARRPRVPVVLITGYATSEQEALAERAGATAFLAKPFDESELVATVRAALESEGPTAEETRP